MKTLYTLLLAFGLCLTSHAQSKIQNLQFNSNIALTNLIYDSFNEIVIGSSNSIVYYDYLKTIHCKSITDINVNMYNTKLSEAEILIVEDIPSSFNGNVDISNFSNIKCVLLILNERFSNVEIEQKFDKVIVSNSTDKFFFINLPN